MKVAELRSQGWTAIQGDVLTNGLSDRIVLSEGGAISVNEGHHDELEIVDLLWRDKTSEDLGFHGNAEYSLDGWKPCLSKVYVEDKSANSNDENPVFTQAMADNGDLPPVGSMCMSEYPEGVWSEVKYMGKGIGGLHVLSYLNGSVDQLGSLIKFKPLDTRTEKQKAVDAANKDFFVDKPTLEAIYDLWAQKIEQ